MHIKPLILLELWCLVSHVTPGNSAILCLCLGRDILVWLLSSGILGLGKNICTEQRWLPQPNFEYNEEVGDVCWTMLMYAYHCLSVLPPASQISAWTILPSGLVSDASEMLSPAFVSELPKRSCQKLQGFWSQKMATPQLHCWGNNIPGSSTYINMCEGYAKLVLPCFALSVATMPC